MSDISTVVAPPEPSSFRLIATLGVAGLLSGLALVVVYVLTLPLIEANKAAALQQAVFKVVPESSQLQKLVPVDGSLVVAPEGDKAPGIYATYDTGGAFKGYAIPADGAGFQDKIELIYGYDPALQRVVGMEILTSKETPGLGDKIFKDQDFVAEFSALAVKPEILPMKAGAGTEAHHVDCITGATISSKAVVKIINQGNATWLEQLPQPGSEPALEQGGE